MNFKKIKTIIGREYSIRVKKKSFILTTILIPILFAVVMILPTAIMMMDTGGEQLDILVVDDSGIVASSLEETSKIRYIISDDHDMEGLKARFDKLGIYAIAHISSLDSLGDAALTTFSTKQINVDVKSSLQSSVSNIITSRKLSNYDQKEVKKILKDVNTNIKVDTYSISDRGEVKSRTEIYIIISFICAIMIYMFIFTFGYMVLRGVIEEKTNRIIEVIISSVKPIELMMGKIIGVALVALTQFGIWVALTLIFTVGLSATFGLDRYIKGGSEMAIVANYTTSSNMVQDTSIEKLSTMIGNNPELNAMLTTLSQINFFSILIVFLIYFILGYLLYASMFAAIGSAVDNETDTQQLVFPVLLPLLLGLFIMMHVMRNPDTSLAFWASMIPFTSPMVMVARFTFGVPFWELALSIGLLLGTFILIAFIAAKIYRVGILSYGKKANFKELRKWIKFKQ